MRTRRLAPSPLPIVLAAVTTAGCGSGERQEVGDAPSGPGLVLVDSVRLEESDSVYIGKPGKPHVDPYDGSFYVPDFFSNQIYRFARNGRLLKTYGRPGQGPGEFRSVAAALVPNDSTLLVIDRGNAKLLVIDRESGRLRSERPISGTPAQAVPLVRGDSVWMHVAAMGPTPDLISFALTGDSARSLGRQPGVYLTSYEDGEKYAQFYGSGAFLSHFNDRLLHGYMSMSWVFVRDHGGTILDSVYVPAVRRRGVPSDLQKQIDVEGIHLMDAMELHSAVFDLHVLPNGMVAVDHQDWTLRSREMPLVPSVRVWISLLSTDLKEACVDAVLLDSSDAKPMETFRGDTVFQLDRRIIGEGEAPQDLRAETWLRIVRIDPSSCDWIPAELPA